MRSEGTSRDCLSRGSYSSAQGHVQSGFKYAQGWRLQHISGQPVPVQTMVIYIRASKQDKTGYRTVPSPAEKGVRYYPKIWSIEKCQKLSDIAIFLLRISRVCHVISVCFLSHVIVVNSVYLHHSYLK